MTSHNEHHYSVQVRWTGNRGQGTKTYTGYGREHEYFAPGKYAAISGSSDAAFRGDAAKYNPEELVVMALSSCHMLWALHLLADSGIVVTSYEDEASGTLIVHADGCG